MTVPKMLGFVDIHDSFNKKNRPAQCQSSVTCGRADRSISNSGRKVGVLRTGFVCLMLHKRSQFKEIGFRLLIVLNFYK